MLDFVLTKKKFDFAKNYFFFEKKCQLKKVPLKFYTKNIN